MDAAAALLRRDGDTLDTRGRVPVQVGHGSRDALEQEVYPRSGDSDVGGELSTIMPQRPRACADRLRTSFLGACGPAVAAGSTLALHGRMGACAAQALAVRLPRLCCLLEPRRTSMFCTCGRRLRGRNRSLRRAEAPAAHWGAAV